MQHNYWVVSASAGSGKTYALVQNILTICLRNSSPASAIRNILALTFTNKAANEMKHRIIEWLKNFSSENHRSNEELQKIQEKLAQLEGAVSMEQLHERSKKILDYVLHNYSTLNIGTIDKFNSRLVRSFSNELGLAQNFNLEINPEPFLLQAVDKMLEDVGAENDISQAFMDFVNYSLDNDERLNLNRTLYRSAKEYIQDKHYFRLDQNKDFDWPTYEKMKSELRDEIKNLKEEIRTLLRQTIDLLIEKDLAISDFAGGTTTSIAKFFYEAERYFQSGRDKFPFPNDEGNAMQRYLSGSSGSGKKRQTEILEILDFLIEQRQKIIANFILSQKKEKILRAILPLKVNKDIQDKLALIEEENDLVLLSKFNVLIHENLRDEPSAFIYEKIGTQFDHYFLDEFQDTSSLQWQNIIPLRDHAVSSKETSFTLVGDPKQSIYRFRGGDAQLMLDIINKKEKTLIAAEVENLSSNWRSAKNIVDFNNELYLYTSAQTRGEHCEMFGSGSHQIAESKIEGRVRVNLFENSKLEVFYEEVAAKMREDIQQCIDNGFTLSDITILCRDNSENRLFSQLLGALKVRYQGEEDYIKTVSEAGLTLHLSVTLKALTEYLRWEQDPKNFQFPVKMLYYLMILGKIHIEDFTGEMLEMLTCKTKREMQDFIEENYALHLKSDGLLQLNLYNIIEHYLQKFSVAEVESDFLFNYLEMVYEYSQNSSTTLKDFLKFWDEEGKFTTIQSSDNLDAVKIMTIHKAKGLEFPVVFLPMKNAHKDDKFNNWFDLDEGNGCASVNIPGFTKEIALYDEKMLKFNEENAYQNKIDRFCLQYVATTRAVEQLFFYIEKENKTSNNLEIFEFLKPKIPKNDLGEELSSFDLYEVAPDTLQKKISKEKAELSTLPINFKTTPPKPDAIKIATPSKSYQNRVEKVRTGIFTHEILAKIKSEADIEKTLDSYLLEGTITQEEATKIRERIYGVLRNPEYAQFFDADQKVINERDIMITENGESKIYRPDRMIDTGNGFVIIDFKTGEIKEKHRLQLDSYQNVLEKLGKKVVKTALIYV